MEITKSNYQEDFEDLLVFIDGLGKDIGLPDFDWDAKFWTGQYYGKNYHVRHEDGVYVNAREESGHVVAVFNNHGLGPGRIHCELNIYLPNEDYPDGIRQIRAKLQTNRELTAEATALPTRLEMQAILPTLKGDPGKDGQSAYETAVEGGFEGSRELFATKLADFGSTEAASKADVEEMIRDAFAGSGGGWNPGTGDQAATEEEIYAVARIVYSGECIGDRE